MAYYKGLIFDLDGTLLNTIDDIHFALNKSLMKNFSKEVKTEDALTFIGNGINKLIERALTFINVDVDEYFESVKKDYKSEYQICSKNQTKPFDGIIEVLTFLKKEGLKLAVLSNKPHDDAVDVINTYFPNLFDVVCGAKEGYNIKPDPSLAFEILQKLGLRREEVLFVGDSDVDIFTAQNAGMDSVGALYGYRPEKELRFAKATYYIKNPKGLLKFFRKDINGVLLIDKPIGYTSQDIVTIIKHKLNIEKAGHAGTLDPFASGLLVVLLGNATKLSNYLLEENKEYIAKVVIGKTTDTLDCDGTFIEEKCVDKQLNIDEVLDSLTGEIELAPPMYSAIKINGQKMYDLARKGVALELEKRTNYVYNLKRISEIEYNSGLAIFEIVCNVSKGTYIRSLCQEIGNRLGYPAYLKSLKRTKSGQMSLEDSFSIEDLDSDFKVLSVVEALKGKKVVKINDAIYKRVINGMKIYLQYETEELVFLEYNNELVAIYELVNRENKQYSARRVWK